MNCSELAVDNMKYVGNNEEYEFINVVQANSIYGKLAKAIKYDDMPSPEDLNHDAVAFVQHASSIASSLQNGKKAVVFCKNGRSRSPCVVAAFYIIFRGLSLLEIKTWFNEVYPRQRPITAAVSSAFPNIDKFENILNLLGRCLADPKKTTWGFNLAGKNCGYNKFGSSLFLLLTTCCYCRHRCQMFRSAWHSPSSCRQYRSC